MSNDHTASSDTGEVREIDRSEYGRAPKITPEVIEQHIASEHYFTAHQGARAAFLDDAVEKGHDEFVGEVLNLPEPLQLLTFCVLVLRNGYTVVGQSACASPSNFSKDIGRRVARGDAINKVWPLLGYMLRDQLHTAQNVGDADVGEALTMMLAHSLGNPDAFKPAHARAIISQFDVDHGEEGGETRPNFKEQLSDGPETGPVR
jgi:hypothetical protein